MSTASNAREYVERLAACLGRCASIDPQQRTTLPRRFDQTRRTWILARGLGALSELFQDDPKVGDPYELIHGGQLKLEVRVRDSGTKKSPAVASGRRKGGKSAATASGRRGGRKRR